MVHRRVEDLAVVGVRRRDADAAELALPRRVSLAARLVEVPSAELRRHVAGGLLGADGRQGHLDQHGLAHVVEVDDAQAGLRLPEAHAGVELRAEVDLLAGGPAARTAHTLDGRVVHLAQVGHRRDVADALVEVDEQLAVALAEGVAMESDALRGRQLDVDVGALQAVVAGPDGLLVVAELQLALLRVSDGQEGQVAQVAAARSGQVGVGEADDDRVAVVIARRPVPAARLLRRAELHHPERHVGADEDVAVATGPDVWVDVLCQSLLCDLCLLGPGCQHRQRCEGQHDDLSHTSILFIYFLTTN